MARIDYIELPSATAHELTRAFYAKAFGWTFTDYGPDYAATTSGDVDLGLNGQPSEALAAPLPVIQVPDLEAAMTIALLATIGNNAPFIGLFGTVLGIIKAFHNMAVMGSGGFSVVAAGISEALVATGLGLAVAIIAVIFYNYFQTRIERIEAALTIASNRVLDAIHLGRRANGAR